MSFAIKMQQVLTGRCSGAVLTRKKDKDRWVELLVSTLAPQILVWRSWTAKIQKLSKMQKVRAQPLP
jgi:hypothetical protein